MFNIWNKSKFISMYKKTKQLKLRHKGRYIESLLCYSKQIKKSIIRKVSA